MRADESRELLWCGGVWLAEVLLALVLLLLLVPFAGLANTAQDAGRGQQEERWRHQHNDTDSHQDPHHLSRDTAINTVITPLISTGSNDCVKGLGHNGIRDSSSDSPYRSCSVPCFGFIVCNFTVFIFCLDSVLVQTFFTSPTQQ